jgi:regulator of RNase E activity RraA
MPNLPERVSSSDDQDARVFEVLVGLSTATISTVLLKNGLRNVWIRRAHPIHSGGHRIAGRAFTMRFVPAREDLATPESLASSGSTRGAIEEMPAGCIAVVDAMGINDVGVAGDILCARMRQRGVAALVTDGAMRDLAGVRETGLPVWCNGNASPPSIAGLTFVGWQQPVGCGGVAVFPGDILVLDEDGAVVVPEPLLKTVLTVAPDTEQMEAWVLEQVNGGRKLTGLYPANQQTTEEYGAWLKARQAGRTP